MREHLLITLGCSWTYGVAVGYNKGMSSEDHKDIAWDPDICNRWSYRGILCDTLGLDNLNFSGGRQSNQSQFFHAKQYFGSDKFLIDQQKYKQIFVLHATTSTARNFFFDIETNMIRHVKYNDGCKFSEFMLKHSYDHEFEVNQLETEMCMWNTFYKAVDVKNIWVDTFNHHKYSANIDNLLASTSQHRDLLSQLCIINNKSFPSNNNSYHKSNWVIDDDRVAALVDCDILNPISCHPTKQGHQQIANIIQPILELLL